jgi:hypothetical protein
MSVLRLLNWQAIAGLAVAFTLLVMLTVQKLEAVHWKKQSETFERLYQQEQAAFATTVANARAVAETARAADQANAGRVAVEQRAITERTTNDFEARLAAVRARAQQLRVQPQTPADPGAGGNAPMPGVPPASGRTAESARQDRLPADDALTATEQAIQLDELIKWVRAQAKVDNNPAAVASPSHE